MLGTAGLTVALGLLMQQPASGWPASAGPAPLLMPAPTPADTNQAWLAKRRRLRIQFGVSAGAFGLSAAALALSVGLANDGEPCLDCYPVGAIVSGVAASVCLIPMIVYAVRLTVHNERRPPPGRMSLGAGGLQLRF